MRTFFPLWPPCPSRRRFRSISSFMILSASLIFFGGSMTEVFFAANGFFLAAAKTFFGFDGPEPNDNLTFGWDIVVELEPGVETAGMESIDLPSPFEVFSTEI